MSKVVIRREDPSLELERLIDAPRGAVWRCWTEPDLLKVWFCPKPWRVAEADFDLRPGGRMNTRMQGPNGEDFTSRGVWLDIDHGRSLTFTDFYTEGFQPQQEGFMTGYVRLSDAEGGATRMIWGARHRSPADVEKHLEMGFEQGWTAASAQLATLAEDIAAKPDGALIFAQKARTCFFISGDVEEAARFYVSVLPDGEIETLIRPGAKGPAAVAEFRAAGASFMVLGENTDTKPSTLTSISILTRDQEELDRLWHGLIDEEGEAGRCGWLKDRFGVHWQIIPEALPRLLSGSDAKTAERVRQAMFSMKKIDIAGLEAAHRGS